MIASGLNPGNEDGNGVSKISCDFKIVKLKISVLYMRIRTIRR